MLTAYKDQESERTSDSNVYLPYLDIARVSIWHSLRVNNRVDRRLLETVYGVKHLALMHRLALHGRHTAI